MTAASSLKDRAIVDIARLAEDFARGEALVGVVGMGYVGQPLAITAHARGFNVVGFDIDPDKVTALNAGHSRIRTIPDARIANMVRDKRFRATSNFTEMSKAEAIVIRVPPPLNKFREPDLSYVERTAHAVAKNLRPGQLVCLESTTYPGTTIEVLKPILEATGLVVGRDVFLAFSPEREDPGNKTFATEDIP